MPPIDVLFRQLEVVAATRNETVSQTARRMLLDGLSTPSTEEAIDTAIASLLAARDRLGKSAS